MKVQDPSPEFMAELFEDSGEIIKHLIEGLSELKIMTSDTAIHNHIDTLQLKAASMGLAIMNKIVAGAQAAIKKAQA